DTDSHHKIVTATDPEERRKQIADTASAKRARMKDVCLHCHTPDYVNNFYTQYDGLVTLYNEKFARPGKEIVTAMLKHGLRTKTPFDEEIEWTWFYLWHHEGRRARHGASMMAPDYTHWHGMYEVAERFYMELIPQAREVVEHAKHDAILARPEHAWFTKGAGKDAEAIRKAMEAKYGAGASGKK
ncbi:MAG: multiheme c-type cytochrome, partial [Planctomycetota bacterium]